MNGKEWFAFSLAFLPVEGFDCVVGRLSDAEQWHEINKKQLAMWKARLEAATTEEEKQQCLENIEAYQEMIDKHQKQGKDEAVEQEGDEGK